MSQQKLSPMMNVSQSPDQFSPQNYGQPSVYNNAPFQTPLPIKTPAIKASNSGDIIMAVESVQNLKQEIESKLLQIEDQLLNRSQNKSVVRSQDPASPFKSVQVPADYIILSPQQLDKIVEDKVKLKLRNYEDQLKQQSQMESRIKSLEESMGNIGKTFLDSKPMHGSNAFNVSLQERLQKVQQQINALGKK